MAINTTRWSPDTCNCVVDYTWDSTVPQDSRVHTFSQMVQRCAAHNMHSDPEIYSILMIENPRKNRAIDQLMTSFSLQLKDIAWSYDSNRVLNLKVPKLTASQQAMAQANLTALIGSGTFVFI